ncbi:MAG: YihY/virulence factor BrkB family protein, partial [Eubacteriales bacterium]|nr:YihY/virulence factor BrkB family protein [Eubacteriales bacterium]
IALIMTLTLAVLGEKLHKLAMEYSSFFNTYLNNVIVERKLVTFLSLFLVFILLFRVLPNRKATFRSQVPGALITAVAWMTFSYGFSYYLEIFPGFTSMYGNMATLMIAMLWLYIMMNLMLFGAEVNIYFEKEFRKIAAILRKRKAVRTEEKENKRRIKEQERQKKKTLSEKKKLAKKREEALEIYGEYLEAESDHQEEKESQEK